ncbi:MAG: hypothetical protein PXY39_01210 [archaeon]|nr:hypothetical protein [archaeon]
MDRQRSRIDRKSTYRGGLHTIAGTDEWGNIVILHFAVTDVGIVSVIGPLEPSNAGGLAVSITLVNLANCSDYIFECLSPI